MKITNLILSVLFVVFTVVQYNDPDPLSWMVAYGFMALLFGFAAAQKTNKKILVGTFLLFVIWSIIFIPDFIFWLKNGSPSIASEMKTDEPHIELVREFLGLIICLGGLTFLLWQNKKLKFK